MSCSQTAQLAPTVILRPKNVYPVTELVPHVSDPQRVNVLPAQTDTNFKVLPVISTAQMAGSTRSTEVILVSVAQGVKHA